MFGIRVTQEPNGDFVALIVDDDGWRWTGRSIRNETQAVKRALRNRKRQLHHEHKYHSAKDK